MMKHFKPGELWTKHQEKMKKMKEKHRKTSPSTNFALTQFGDRSLPSAKPRSQANSGSTVMGTNPKYFKKRTKHRKHKKTFNTTTKKTGKFEGKSNALGHGGRAAQLKARGVPGGVIGAMARAAHAAPGQANYHGKHKKHEKVEDGMKFGSAEWRAKYMKKKKHEKHEKHMKDSMYCKVCKKSHATEKHEKHMKHEKNIMHCKMCHKSHK